MKFELFSLKNLCWIFWRKLANFDDEMNFREFWSSDQIWLDLNRRDHTWDGLITTERAWSLLRGPEQAWADQIWLDQIWSEMIKPIWLDLIRPNLIRPNLIRTDQTNLWSLGERVKKSFFNPFQFKNFSRNLSPPWAWGRRLPHLTFSGSINESKQSHYSNIQYSQFTNIHRFAIIYSKIMDKKTFSLFRIMKIQKKELKSSFLIQKNFKEGSKRP